MSLRRSELRQVAQEMTERLAGAVVQKAFSPAPRTVYLEFRQIGRSTLWCLCAEPGLTRIGLADARPPTPNPPPSFQARLRQELTGARFTSAQLQGDAVEVRFTRQERDRSLWLDTNLVLVVSGKVIGASPPGPKAGQPYIPPGVSCGSTTEARATEHEDAKPGEEAPSRLVPDPAEPFGYSQAAERLLAAREVGQRADDLRRRLAAPLKAKLTRTARTLAKVRAEARRQGEAERHRQLGELLARTLHQVRRGQKDVLLTRNTETGPIDERRPLDPRRTPKDLAVWSFHQYTRLLRGCEHAARRERELTEQREALQAQLERLRSLPDESLLTEAPRVPPPKVSRRARPYKEYAGHGGRIWVGKGSDGNDVLTFKVARPHDLWLHARGVPGSHVIVPLAKGTELPQELLLDAAHLALHHSGYKGEPRGEVSYTQAKFVRKQKGGGAGQVIYTREKTMMVRLEPGRLERLLRTEMSP
ncbi:MAG: NFACT RNA binding domain-containing protein [Myxococcaceae bacterium]